MHRFRLTGLRPLVVLTVILFWPWFASGEEADDAVRPVAPAQPAERGKAPVRVRADRRPKRTTGGKEKQRKVRKTPASTRLLPIIARDLWRRVVFKASAGRTPRRCSSLQ